MKGSIFSLSKEETEYLHNSISEQNNNPAFSTDASVRTVFTGTLTFWNRPSSWLLPLEGSGRGSSWYRLSALSRQGVRGLHPTYVHLHPLTSTHTGGEIRKIDKSNREIHKFFCNITVHIGTICMCIYDNLRVHDRILGQHFNKRLESFAPWYSKSFLLVDFKENHTLLWFKKSVKKPRYKKTRVYPWIEPKNDGRKPDKNWFWEDLSLCPESSTKNAVQEFHLR